MKIFPTENEKIITFSIVSLVSGLIVGIIVSHKFTDLSFILTSLTTLVAAFLGAKFAFQMQTKKQEEERIKSEVTAGNKAIFEIIRTYNKFVAIRNQFINPNRNNPARHYFIHPISGINNHITSIDYDSLSFLMNTKTPDILNKLSAFEQEANSTIEAINHRSKLHFDVIQPAIEKAENKHGPQLTEQQIDTSVGSRYMVTIKMSTDIMVECVDSVISLAETDIETLRNLLKQEYKGHNIIKMQILNKSFKPTPKSGAI